MSATAEEVQGNVETEQNEKRIAVESIINAFIDGKNDDKEDDDIKISMIQAGAKFSKVNKIFGELLIEYGFEVSNERREEVVTLAVQNKNLSQKEDFEYAVAEIVEMEDKLNERKAGALVRGYCKKNNLEFYKKPKVQSTRTSFIKDFYQALLENPNMTEEETHNLIVEKGSENTLKFESSHQKIRKLVNGIAEKYAI